MKHNFYNKDIKVAVLLATYNGANWLPDSLNSILSQDANLTLFISDDFSDDDTYDLLTKFSADDKRIFLLPRVTKFGSAGKNFFHLLTHVDFSEFDYISFADQDDIWVPDKISRALYFLENHSADGYSSAVMAFWEDGGKKILRQSSRITNYDHFFEGAGQGCTFVFSNRIAVTASSIISRHRKVFNEIHYHDWFIYALVREMDFLWFFDSRVSLYYRQHFSNDTGAKNSLAGILRRLSLIKNGWYRQQIISILKVLMQEFPESKASRKIKSLIYRDGGSWLPNLWFFLTRCRRKFSDRAILALSFVLGWI